MIWLVLDDAPMLMAMLAFLTSPEPCFVIRWTHGGYVTKRSPNRKPYASDKSDPDTKVWKTQAAAQRWLDKKDRLWAASCVIEAM